MDQDRILELLVKKKTGDITLPEQAELSKLLNQNPSFKILTNDKNSQSIISKSDFFMAVFHKKGKITVGKNTIEVDRPCLLLYGKNYFYLSDPTHNGGMLNFICNKKKYSTTFPADGSTIKFMQ